MTTNEQPSRGHPAERCGGGPRGEDGRPVPAAGRKLAAEVSPEHFHLERFGQFGGS